MPDNDVIKVVKQLILNAKKGNAGLIVIQVNTAEKLIKLVETKNG